MKKLLLVLSLVMLSACTTTNQPVSGRAVDCSTVRCAACPAGEHPALTPPDCCRCVKDR